MSTINKKTVGAVAIIAIVAVAAVAVVVFMPGGTPSEDPIRVGILEPLTGGTSASGRGALYGFQVAAQQINEAGGILGRQVVLIAEDTEGNPEKGVSAATKLITVDNVDVLMGVISSAVVMGVAEVAADYQVPFISTNPTTSAFTELVSDDYERYKYLFRTQWNVTQWMFAWFDDFTSLFPDIDSLMFVTEDLTWAREADVEMEAFCTAAGMDYEGLLFTPGTTDFTPEIAQIETFDPDIVLVDLLLSTSISLQKQWWALKPDILFVGASGVLSYPSTIRELGAEESNYTLTYNHLWNVSLTEHTVDYFNDFYLFSGQEPFGADITSYDGLMLYSQAVEAAASTNADGVVSQLETGTFTAGRGTYEFMDNHQAAYIPGVILQWINTEPTVIWPTSLATGSYQRPPWITSP